MDAPGIRSLLCVIALSAIGCDREEEHLQPVALERPATPRVEAPTPEPPARPEEGPLIRRERGIMGTTFQLSTFGMDEAQAGPLLERALDEIERLEDVLSEWRETSEIGRINANAGGEAVEVGPDTLAVITAGLEVSRLSGGAFDLSWAALRGLYTFTPGDERVPPIGEVRRRLTHVRWQDIEVDGSSVRLAHAGMAIGTGGIGKGYALDRAGAVLREGGADSYMLFGGGQVQVHGMHGERPWRVGIQHPRDPANYIGFLEAENGSMSTSGDYEHAFVDRDGQHWHHIIDLETGLPARRTMQVTLLAERGVYADALSTAAFVLGPERALEMLARTPGHPEAVIIDDQLRLYTTPGTRERLVLRVSLGEEDRLPGDPAFGSHPRAVADPSAPE